MTLEGLFIIAFGSAFAVFWLIQYVPVIMTLGKRIVFSPRLLVCKLLAPFDAGMTLLLIVGGWVGISSSVVGISMMVFNVLVGLGLSIGVILIKKFMVPRWTKEFETKKAAVLR
jgi:hypothetical protein